MNAAAHPWLYEVPASAEVLRDLRSVDERLPDAYLDLLQQGNGGEVGLQVDPFMLCLDSAEDALSYWRSGTYTADGVFVFGGNGGGALLAFDLRSPDRRPVVFFDPIDPEGSMELLAADFTGLLALCEEH
jgi:SMI1 / KNR4 family (SUKH-1)